jgi:hypothetical protein
MTNMTYKVKIGERETVVALSLLHAIVGTWIDQGQTYRHMSHVHVHVHDRAVDGLGGLVWIDAGTPLSI